jgi:hypothetical protein
MFRRSDDRRKSDSDLYVRLDGQSPRRQSKKGDDSLPLRTSLPFDFDAERFLKNSLPATYQYSDSPSNTRRRRSAGIEKHNNTTLGVPGSFQHLGSRGETLVCDENMSVCMVACMKHLLNRIEDLEHMIRRMRTVDTDSWRVQMS